MSGKTIGFLLLLQFRSSGKSEFLPESNSGNPERWDFEVGRGSFE
ncbi:MAG: hypothetical protein ACNS62_18690 [Candidatus Cyclobacteriaceae bacterium M3_2C_046]